MVAPANKSSIINQIKKEGKGGFAKSANNDIKIKGQQIPSDLVNAVGKFLDYTIAKNKNNQPYIMLKFVIVEPEENKGLKFNKMTTFAAGKKYPGSDREPKSYQDRLDDFGNDLQLMGNNLKGKTEDDWEAIMKKNKKDGVLVYFNTVKFEKRKGDTREPQTYIMLQGPVEDGYEAPTSEETEVTDEPEPDAEEPEVEAEAEEGGDAFTDMDRNALKKALKEHGVEFTVTTKTTDDAIREALRAGVEPEAEEEAEEPEAEEEEAEWQPKTGELYNYTPKGKKKMVVKIVLVNTNKKTVSVKGEKDKVVYKDIPWDSLAGEE